MRKLMRARRGLAGVLAAAISAALAGGVRAQGAAPAPVITPPIDATVLAQATAKGQAMLSKAQWKAELKLNIISMDIAGPTLVCSGNVRQEAVVRGRGGLVAPTGFGGAAGNGSTTGFGGPSYKSMVLDTNTGRSLWEIPAILYSPMLSVDGGLLGFEGRDGVLKLRRWTADSPGGTSVWETTYTPPPAAGGTSQAHPIFADQQIIAGE